MQENFFTVLEDANKKYILQAVNEKRLVIFIGAGVSRLMGVSGWDDFSNRLVQQAFPLYNEQTEILAEIKNSKEKISIAYEKMHQDGRDEEFFKAFGEALQGHNRSDNRDIYEKLKQLKTIYLTTNADALFEKHLGKDMCHSNLDPIYLEERYDKGRGHLFYLHGKYTGDKKDNDNLVFTAAQYISKYNSEQMQTFLRKIFDEKNGYIIVFIGYGLNEFELIDYMMTKTGMGNRDPRKLNRIFLLEGFCSGKEILYKARKTYFEELNITLLPYCMDNNGYDALFDVVDGWRRDFIDKTDIFYLNMQDVTRHLDGGTTEDKQAILYYLKDDDILVQQEEVIVQGILKRDDELEWLHYFILNGLYDNQFVLKKNNRYWKPYDLLFKGLSVDDALSNNATKQILDMIVENSKAYFNCCSDGSSVVRMIYYLSVEKIDIKYISLLSQAINKTGIFLLLFNIQPNRIVEWPDEVFREYLKKSFACKADYTGLFDQDYDIYSRFIEVIFNALQANKQAYQKFKIWIEEIIHIIERQIEREKYLSFTRYHDFDHIAEDTGTFWALFYKSMCEAVQCMSDDDRESLLISLFDHKLGAIKQTAIYLCRKSMIDPNKFVKQLLLCLKDSLLCELFLWLSDNKKLNENNQRLLLRRIKTCCFGLGRFARTVEGKKYISSIRLALSLALSGEEATQYAELQTKKGVKPYDFIEDARSYGCVRVVKTENPQIDKSLWEVDLFNQLVSVKKEDEFHFYRYEAIIREVLISMGENDFQKLLSQILSESYDFDKVKRIVLESIRTISFELSEGKQIILYNTAIQLLENDHYANEKHIGKLCFQLIGNYNVPNEETAEKIKHLLKKYYICYNKSQEIDDSIANSFDYVNSIWYEKNRVCFNYLAFIREKKKDFLKLDEEYWLLDAIWSKPMLSLGFCTCREDLFLIFGDDAIQILKDILIHKENFNLRAFMHCFIKGGTGDGWYAFLSDNNLFEKYNTEIKAYSDVDLLSRFYTFLTFSFLFEKIGWEEIRLFYCPLFTNTYLNHIPQWKNKFINDFDKCVCQYYDEVYPILINEKDRVKTNEIMLWLVGFLQFPTIKTLDTYISILNKNDCRFVDFKADILLRFLKVDYKKGVELILIWSSKSYYIDKSGAGEVVKNLKDEDAKIFANRALATKKITMEIFQFLFDLIAERKKR